MYCKNCGAENSSGVFCASCGTPLGEEQQRIEPQRAYQYTNAKVVSSKTHCGQTIKNFASAVFVLLTVLHIGIAIAGITFISQFYEYEEEIAGLFIFGIILATGILIYLAKALSSLVYGFGIIVSSHEEKNVG